MYTYHSNFTIDCSEFNTFHHLSYDKTTLYRIGSLRHSDARMYNIDQFAWSNKDITVLGVQIAHEDIMEKKL